MVESLARVNFGRWLYCFANAAELPPPHPAYLLFVLAFILASEGGWKSTEKACAASVIIRQLSAGRDGPVIRCRLLQLDRTTTRPLPPVPATVVATADRCVPLSVNFRGFEISVWSEARSMRATQFPSCSLWKEREE